MSNKIKVLILHNYMTPYRFPLFREISKNKDLDVWVFFMSKSAKNRKWKNEYENLGFNYKIMEKIEINFFGKDLFTYIINYKFPFQFLRSNFDIVISAGWLDFASQIAFFLCKLTGKKFIIWSESTINEPSWRRVITLPLVKYIVRKSDACIAIGSQSKRYLFLLGANIKKVFVAYSTIDTDFFSRRSKMSKTKKTYLKNLLGIKTRKTILYVGQFIQRKGVMDLLKAFKAIEENFSDLTLLLLGYGPEKKSYINYIEQNKIKNVVFSDHVEVNDMPKIYGLADVFVLPSHEETWGLVVNEAMSAGLPVIATDICGSSFDLIKNGKNGFIYQVGDVNQLARHLSIVLRDSVLRKRMSLQSKKYITGFTPKNAAHKFVDAIMYVNKDVR